MDYVGWTDLELETETKCIVCLILCVFMFSFFLYNKLVLLLVCLAAKKLRKSFKNGQLCLLFHLWAQNRAASGRSPRRKSTPDFTAQTYTPNPLGLSFISKRDDLRPRRPPRSIPLRLFHHCRSILHIPDHPTVTVHYCTSRSLSPVTHAPSVTLSYRSHPTDYTNTPPTPTDPLIDLTEHDLRTACHGPVTFRSGHAPGLAHRLPPP